MDPIEIEPLPDLPSRLDRVRQVAIDLQRVPDVWLAPLGSQISGVEWFILGAIKRTSSNAEGFCQLVEAKNTLAAAALLRLQLDTAMRVHGLDLTPSAEDAGELLWQKGLRYDRLQAKNGTKLKDVHLHDSLSKEYPWVSAVYQEASDYIHLSGEHMRGAITSEVNGMLFFRLDAKDGTRPDNFYFHLVDTFYMVADLTSKLIRKFAEDHPGPDVRKHGWRDR